MTTMTRVWVVGWMRRKMRRWPPLLLPPHQRQQPSCSYHPHYHPSQQRQQQRERSPLDAMETRPRTLLPLQ